MALASTERLFSINKVSLVDHSYYFQIQKQSSLVSGYTNTQRLHFLKACSLKPEDDQVDRNVCFLTFLPSNIHIFNLWRIQS